MMLPRALRRLANKSRIWRSVSSATAASDRAPVSLGTVSPMRSVPDTIERPPYVGASPPAVMPPLQNHTEEGISCMRAACRLSADVLAFAGSLVAPGVTADEVDAAAHEFIVKAGAYPSPLGYAGFPKSLCTSVNEVVCHGIPDSRPFADGDIVSIDVSCFLNGYHGDNCRTFFVGEVDPEARRLVDVTKLAVDEAIKLCGPGQPFNAIGHCIHDIADQNGLEVVRNYTGHGVGSTFHTLPWVLHYRSAPYGEMQPGTTFTIEPMLTLGMHDNHLLRDNWTVVTNDGSLSAQFEHTILITEDGAEVLTSYPDDDVADK